MGGVHEEAHVGGVASRETLTTEPQRKHYIVAWKLGFFPF
jgi:hypothetical protein